MFLLLHIPLVLLIRRYPVVGQVHTWATLAVGVAWAASGVSLGRVAAMAAYIAGAEVLWRMTGSYVFWEFGKYAVVLILFLSIQRARPLKATSFPVVFLALLVPSTLLTILNADPAHLRMLLSFNLSGPLALAVCAAFFSRVRLTPVRIQRMVVALLGPLIGVACLCVLGIVEAEGIVFTTESNRQLSGGGGSNQVSCALAFGALMALLSVLCALEPRQRRLQWLLSALAFWLVAQSALTFSRSGLYLAAGGAVAAACFVWRDARTRATILVMSAFVCVVGWCVVAPRLDAFTAGMLSKRFSDTGLTGRERIMKMDIMVWLDNPVLGVGPGMAKVERLRNYGNRRATHTELTRLLAEHGMLGVLAIGMLSFSGWHAFSRAKSLRWKGFIAAMLTFTLLYMLSNAMRLVLPAFAFGLAFATFKHE